MERLKAAWSAEVQSHYDHVSRAFPCHTPLLTSLYGSQNYQLALSGSDVDTKTIVLPSLWELVTSSQPLSADLAVNDAIAVVKDIRSMSVNYLKCNISFLETLYSEYQVLNPNTIADELIANRDLIANSNPYRLVQSTAGTARQKFQAYLKSAATPLGYDAKPLTHLVRLSYFLKTYNKDADFASALLPNAEQRQFLYYIKQYGPTATEADKIAKEAFEVVEEQFEAGIFRFKKHDVRTAYAKEFLNDFSYRAIKDLYDLNEKVNS